MNYRRLLFILSLLCCSLLNAQVVLPYAINTEGLPADTSKLKVSETVGGVTPGFFATSGFQETDIIAMARPTKN